MKEIILNLTFTSIMMQQEIQFKNNRQIAIWLLIGVGMIVIQVLLGGITRLTESGLSITEWKPITGALPPLNETAWQIEFEKYRHTDQFKYVHQSFSMHEFKFIFFWEWFHRLWARLMGMVFLIGFTYFLFKRKFSKSTVTPMIVLFCLGGVQGAIGWIMVKSGLVPEKYFVGHIELTTHFIAALILLAYTLWFAMNHVVAFKEKIYQSGIRKLLLFILGALFIQLIFGGFMAGLKAAISAPTWPSINGYLFPPQINELSPWKENLINNKTTIHFIHRGMGYLILILTIIFFVKTNNINSSSLFRNIRFLFLISVGLQIVLGISALLISTNPSAFVYVGVAHQFTAMLIVMCVTALLFLIRKENAIPAESA